MAPSLKKMVKSFVKFDPDVPAEKKVVNFDPKTARNFYFYIKL
jgi:hypothetical protein